MEFIILHDENGKVLLRVDSITAVTVNDEGDSGSCVYVDNSDEDYFYVKETGEEIEQALKRRG